MASEKKKKDQAKAAKITSKKDLAQKTGAKTKHKENDPKDTKKRPDSSRRQIQGRTNISTPSQQQNKNKGSSKRVKPILARPRSESVPPEHRSIQRVSARSKSNPPVVRERGPVQHLLSPDHWTKKLDKESLTKTQRASQYWDDYPTLERQAREDAINAARKQATDEVLKAADAEARLEGRRAEARAREKGNSPDKQKRKKEEAKKKVYDRIRDDAIQAGEAAAQKKAEKLDRIGKTREPFDIINTVGPELLKQLGKEEKKSESRLELFRNMSHEEARNIMNWYNTKETKGRYKKGEGAQVELGKESEKDKAERLIRDSTPEEREKLVGDKHFQVMPIKNHLGDEKQATDYLYRANEDVTLIKVTLKPGAHNLMYTPEYMALMRSGGAMTALAEAKRQEGEYFAEAKGGEGNHAGYIGVKSEGKQDEDSKSAAKGNKKKKTKTVQPEEERRYSIALGENKASQLLFQLMVDKVEIVGRKNKVEGAGN